MTYSSPASKRARTLKPKVAAIVVVGILVVSTALTAAAAVDQVVSGDISGSGGPVPNQTADGIQQGPEDRTLVRTLKLICPFH